MEITVLTLKQGLILFWALWISLVVLHNIFDALKELGVLPESWRFVSTNFQGIYDLIGGERTPRWVAGLLYTGAIVWEVFTAYLFWVALLASRGAINQSTVITAFAANLTLWAVFMLADEAFGDYELGAAHLRFVIAQLVTLMFILLVPG
jgi:hypothetical protein